MKKKLLFLFLTIIVSSWALPLLLHSQEQGMPDLEKLLQRLPDLRGKASTLKSSSEAKRQVKGREETPTTAQPAEKTAPAFPALEGLILEKGILPPEELKVFGQQLFANGPASFTPPANIPVTADYILGPDDTIVVNVWGRINETYNLTVQRNGSVFIPQVGSIHVGGLAYKQMVTVVRKEVESVLGVSASVTMGDLRSITVFIVGAVKQPGAYTVSAFDTILNALIYSGGPEVQSLLDDWYRTKLKQENVDVRQLVERLKEEREKAFPREKKTEPGLLPGNLPSQQRELLPLIQERQLNAQPYSGIAETKKSAAQVPSGIPERKERYSNLMELLAILKDERQSEDVIKRVRELNADQLQKELESLETAEKRRDKYAALKQFVEKLKSEKELEKQQKDYEKLDIQQLEEELGKLNLAADVREKERDYTLQQHVFPEKRYKDAPSRSDKEVLLAVQLGSMRNIQLKRNDRVVSTFDLYDLLLKGDKSKDVRLQQGDVIFVPKPEVTVAVYGDVKVPALYELKKDQSLLTALDLAGGLKSSGYGGQIQVQRYEGNQQRVVLDASLESLKSRKDSFMIQDGDRVRVFPVADEDVNAVYLFGNVKRPGKYQFRSGLRVADLLSDKDLQPETDLSYAFVKRYKRPAMEPTILSFGLGEAVIQQGPAENLSLEPYDEIYVFRRWDFQSKPDVTISGEVHSPGKYPFQKNMRVKDVLLMAGGPSANAYLGAAHIFRINPQTRETAMLVIDIGHALAGRDQDNIIMQDKDRLVVHHIREYKPQQYVTVEGEVALPGQYPLTEGMTIRDLILAAGNLKESAYLDEAELSSMIIDERQETKYENRNLSLRKIIAGGLEQNILLRSYDRLFVKRIPAWRLEKFATIAGEVRFPGTYAIRKGERLSSLIERAGGYTPQAYFRSAFFTRERVRELQQAGLNEMADRMQRELLSAGSAQLAISASAEALAALQGELAQKQKFVESLKELKATGRMTIKLTHLRLLKGSEYDIELEDKDKLLIGEKNSVVNVVGSVMSQGTFVYSEKRTYDEYINMTGGYAAYADKSNIFVLKADGSAQKVGGWLNWNNFRNRWEFASFGEDKVNLVEPGDTIVVPEKISRIAWMREIKDLTQILMNTAVAAGVVLRL